MSIYNNEYKKSGFLTNYKFTTKDMAIAGMLGGLSIALSMTPIGYIPIPILGINATTMHIPVIIGSILGGPMIGTFVGIIFGISSMLRATTPFFADPRVAILPRLIIGIFTYYSYKLTNNSIIAAIIGTITNTIGVLSMIYFLGYLPLEVVMGVAGINGVAEIIVSSVIVYVVVGSMKKIKNRI
ncbi:MAG: ECF transporter S component [Clostridiales bacterium]|nr:ECF transporter S component [Clostridiales bacterium]